MRNSNQKTFKAPSKILIGNATEKQLLIEESYNYSKAFRDSLIERLSKDVIKSQDDADNKTNYLNPNWQLEQADHCGYRRALKEIIELLKK
jgi:hypothetical protein